MDIQIFTSVAQSQENILAYFLLKLESNDKCFLGITMMFHNYLKTTWRNITRHKGYSFINIAGLALGMACCMTIALYIQFELSFDNFHKNKNRIFRLVEKQFFEGQDETNLGQSTPWMGETFTEYPEVSMAVNFINMGTIWTKYKDEMVEIPRALIADPDVF